MALKRIGISSLFVVLLVSCGSKDSFVDQVYAPNITQILVEVDYMEGMDPYTSTNQSEPLWTFFKNNISALFKDTKNIEVPLTLQEMQAIPAQFKNYAVEDVKSIAASSRDQAEFDGASASLYIVFLDGYFVSDGEVKKDIIGVSLGGTSIIAIFKPVIDNQTALPQVKRFIEQSVLIHESGHAFGLVNNGVSLTSNHQDTEHGAHCSNQDCVMYYLNEGLQDLIGFIQGGFNLEEIIFKDECLSDVHARVTL